jgi:hypothetical protein
MYVCPSRTSPIVKQPKSPFGNASNKNWPGHTSRSDFAGCKGSRPGSQGMIVGPNDNPKGAPPVSPRLQWQIEDGLSNVFLCGHRYLNPLEYNTRHIPCNGEGWTVGNDWDNMASTDSDGPLEGNPNAGNCSGPFASKNYIPMQDNTTTPSCGEMPPGACHTWKHPRGGRFGSPHAVLPMAMADGSVQGVSYEIDRAVFELLGNVADGGSSAELTQ